MAVAASLISMLYKSLFLFLYINIQRHITPEWQSGLSSNREGHRFESWLSLSMVLNPGLRLMAVMPVCVWLVSLWALWIWSTIPLLMSSWHRGIPCHQCNNVPIWLINGKMCLSLPRQSYSIYIVSVFGFLLMLCSFLPLFKNRQASSSCPFLAFDTLK